MKDVSSLGLAAVTESCIGYLPFLCWNSGSHIIHKLEGFNSRVVQVSCDDNIHSLFNTCNHVVFFFFRWRVGRITAFSSLNQEKCLHVDGGQMDRQVGALHREASIYVSFTSKCSLLSSTAVKSNTDTVSVFFRRHPSTNYTEIRLKQSNQPTCFFFIFTPKHRHGHWL